jgi:hypothetical protein
VIGLLRCLLAFCLGFYIRAEFLNREQPINTSNPVPQNFPRADENYMQCCASARKIES